VERKAPPQGFVGLAIVWYLVADFAAVHGLWLAENIAYLGVAVSVATFFYRWFEAIRDAHPIAHGEGSNP